MNLPGSDQGGRRRAGLGFVAKLLLIIVMIACIGLAAGEFRSHILLRGTKAAAPRDDAAIAVTVSKATRRDVPIYVTGLGTVQASDTIAIHTQVDGKLESVAFTEGQEVHQGDLLAQLDPRMFQAILDQAQAKQAADDAQLIGAEKDLERFQTLVSKNAESIQTVDRQQALVDQIKANIEADQAAIKGAQTQLDYTRITAPMDGRVGIRQIDPGNIVHPADTTPIVTLARTKPISVLFSLPQKNLSEIREALKSGALSVTAFDQDGQKALAEGTVDFVDNAVEPTTDTIRLKGLFENNREELWPGQFVNVRLRVELLKDALTIPSAAIQRGPQGLYVWVVGPNKRAAMRPVQIGSGEDDFTTIASGLAEGEQVVVDGQYKLQPNVRVMETGSASPGMKTLNSEDSS
jgi:multidrug efflux system membrane fusion protein